MFEIALCDDSKAEIEVLKAMVYKYCKEIKIQTIITSYLNGFDLIKSPKKFNAIFLDIKMDEIDGIQVAKEIRKRNKHVKIIYVTYFSNYQNQAFDVRAFGYIMKPISYHQVCEQINDIIEYSEQESKKMTYTFDTDKGIKTLELEDIYFFESYYHKIKIVSKNASYIIVDSIQDILKNLKSYGFSMPHKSFVINLLHISNIKGYNVILTNGLEIPISQKRAVEFKSEFHAFLKNNFNLLIKR